jgi:competence protein ComEA
MAVMENIDFQRVLRRLRQWVAFIGPQRIVAGCCTAVALGGIAWFVLKPSPVPIDAYVPRVTTVSATSTPVSPAIITVHVAGAVNSPGVYRLPSSARVVDAIASAGGALRTADLESINLAQTMTDTEQVYIPSKSSSRPRVTTAPRLRPQRITPTTAPTQMPATSDGSTGSQPTRLINLNTATASELDSLPGVGPSTAKAIISYRTKKGSFSKVEDLLNVPGIGPAKLAALRDQVTVS